MKTGKIFASAGCGKTTALLNLLEDVFRTNNIGPEKVLFTTFTRAGAYEARDRAISKFPHFGDNDFPYFRTLHSTCFRAISSPNIMTRPPRSSKTNTVSFFSMHFIAGAKRTKVIGPRRPNCKPSLKWSA